MNRWVILAGVVVASIILFQIQSGKLVTQDIIDVMGTNIELDDDSVVEEQADVEEEVDEFNDGPKFDSHVYGAVIPSSNAILADFYMRLKNNQDVNTFILITENHSRRGRDNIISTTYGFETPFGDLDLDLEKIKDLELETSNRAFINEEAFNNSVAFIKDLFPEAKIIPISIKKFAKEEELSEFAEKLTEISDEKTVVIAATNFAEGVSHQTALFHDELATNVFESFDINGINQLDVDSRQSMEVLFKYLEEIEAMDAYIFDSYVDEENSFLNVVFYEGERASDDRDLTIMAFGDMMLGRYVRTLMNQYGNDYIFENIAGYENRFFEGADVIFGNFEGPIKGEGTSGGTSMVFSFNEDVAPLLKKYGFNLLSLANNHAVDQGWNGRDSTIEALEASGLGWCGHPSEADSQSVYYNIVGEKSYAFICFHDVTFKLDDEAAVNLIEDVSDDVDFLVVSIHWGYEYKHSPDWGTQIEPGRAFIDAGADFVIGHHPHVVQSFEEYNGKLIFYSLGNFVFDQYWSQMTQEELAIGIVLDDEDNGEGFSTKVYLFPMKSEMSQSRLLTEEEYDSWIEEFITYGDYSQEMKEMIRDGIIEVGT